MNNKIEQQGAKSIVFDQNKYDLLKKAVKLAKQKNVKDFLFDEVFMLTEYAEGVLDDLKIHFDNGSQK